MIHVAAVGAVLVARRRPRPAGVRARPGLREPVRADHPAARHRNEVPLLLIRGAGQVERAAAERRMSRHDQPERTPHPADLFDRDGIGKRIQADPAFILGDRDPEPAHLAQPLDDLDWKAMFALVLLDDRRDLLLHELADGRAKERVLPGQVEVHEAEGSITTDADVSC